MKILIVPMVAIAQTSGPSSRAEALATTFEQVGFETTLCYAANANPKALRGVRLFPLCVPTPMGLPKWLGSRIFPLAEKLGVIGRKPIHSFEQVLHLSGTLAYPYLRQSVEEIRSIIKDCKPDLVYSEFSLPAMIAAQAEHAPIFASYSYPVQPNYASAPQFAGAVNRLLHELELPSVHSSLELFARADCRVVPSSSELEPMTGDHLLFVGPFQNLPVMDAERGRDCVLAYMGYGTIPKKRMLRVLSEAFEDSGYQAYIAGMGPEETTVGNLHTAYRFDFASLLPHAVLLIDHGGQNSVMDGLRYGVPQLICPGQVFERRFNAQSVAEHGAGRVLSLPEFTAVNVRGAALQMTAEPSYAQNARALGISLAALGGADAVVRAIRERFPCTGDGMQG